MDSIALGAVGLLVFSAAVGTFSVVSMVDGLALVERGVEVPVVSQVSQRRGGRILFYEAEPGQRLRCNVTDPGPHETVVYDPEQPSRCRATAAVGGFSFREKMLLGFAALLAVLGGVGVVVNYALSFARDPLDDLL